MIEKIKNNLKETIKLAIPLSLSQLGHVLMGIVDTIMVGWLGAESLAAAGLISSVFHVLLVLGIGLSFAVTPLVAVAKGSGDEKEYRPLFINSLLINAVTAFIIVTVIVPGAEIIRYLNQPSDVVAKAIPYMRIIGFSVLPVMLFQSYKQFLEGLSDVKVAMYINLLANVANVFFNWVLIYGKLGFPELGLNGAGIATLSTRILMSLSLVFYVNRSESYIKFIKTGEKIRLSIEKVKKLLAIGLPSALQMVVEVTAFSSIGIMIGWLGTTQLAAHQIALNLASTTFMIMMGISSAGTIRVGNAVGEKDNTKIRYAGFTSIFLCVLIMFFFGIVFVLFKDILPYIYINDNNVIRVVSKLLMIAALFQIFDGMQASSIGALRGLSDVKFPALIIFIAYWVIGVPLGAFLTFSLKWDVYGIWSSFVFSLIFVGVLMAYRFHKLSKKFIKE